MRVPAAIAGLLLVLGGLMPAAVEAQGPPTWVRTFPKVGPQGCNNWAAEWSDGTLTATVWDCGDQSIRNQELYWVRSFEQKAENGCIELVTEYTRGYYTWIPFSCPEGVVYYKPDWYLVPPWNGQPMRGSVPGNIGAAQPQRPTPTVIQPQPVSIPVAPQPAPPPVTNPDAVAIARVIDFYCAERADAMKTTASVGGRTQIRPGESSDSPYIRLLDARIAQEQATYFRLTGQQYPLPEGCAPAS